MQAAGFREPVMDAERITMHYRSLEALFEELESTGTSELIDGWLARIRRLLKGAQEAGEISRALDVDFEAKAIWAYSAGIGQLSLLHSGLLPVDAQKQLISAYLEKLVAH